MKKEDLIAMGLTEEQAEKVLASLKDGYVSKADFDQVDVAKKEAEKQIKERDKQLGELKKLKPDELQAEITRLQEDNKTAKEKFDSDLKELKLNSAIKLAVAGKVHDEDLTASQFDKSKLILGDDGKITGLDEQLKTLQDNKKFLFKSSEPTGYTPKDGSTAVKNPFDKDNFNLTEQGKLFKENPAQAKELASAAGITL